ncbi:Cobalt-zinc-cadmium resistance protein CzcA [Candidatus Brocadiaceae bacterium B188]|nr:efflux RND transporter permease subunit [Candidatus Brocadia sapporoensis]QQR66303.1 MAG: efflux RND transporter permease subunit [Candidatus Brocadia sp.]RZV58618.1 MAG: efflux RND transporter permease subunit [Candidatus Brocadia sp. BROELEC01]TWU53259.1 Cobalt-zinc-cadmium resistance protein CzcA [Candidatus Brocadiaceae bacterium B188]
MTFVDWTQSHRRSILSLLAALALGGLASSTKLPVALFPRVSFPRIVVSLEAGDRPAERMAIEVTWPVEESVRSIPGALNVRSKTSRGSADISINFEWGEDMIAAMLQVESAINQTLPSLPQGTAFHVRRMDTTVFPVLAYSLTSDTHSLIELRDIALYQLRPLLSTIEGVARIEILGGAIEEYRVTVSPAQLASYNLSLSDISKALSAANVITAVGRLEDHYKLYLIISDTQLPGLDQIRETILRSGQNGMVRLDDVATVIREAAPQWTRVTADGHDAVIFQIYQQPGGNTVQIDNVVKKKLAEFRKQLPVDLKIANWYDQSKLIVASAVSVRDAIIIGVALAALILLVFLRNLKVTLIAIVSVPCVLASTILMLYGLHMSFDIMTLGGMAAAVGLIVDDTIVMVEHIIRRMRGSTDNHHNKTMLAAREFTKPLAASSASTIIIFAPLAFLSGVTGAFFKALSLTIAASLVISFFVALLAVPILADHLLSEKDTNQKEGGVLTEWTHWAYEAVMHRIMMRPWLALAFVVPLIATGWFSYKHMGSGFMPVMDEGGFVLDYLTPPGTSPGETDRLLRRVETILQSTPEVDTYSRRTGIKLGGGLAEANEGDFFVRLKPFPRRDINVVMNDIRVQAEQSVPGIEIEMAQLMEDLIGDLTAVPQPIEIKLYSNDGGLLIRLGPQVADAIRKIPGVVDVRDGVVLAGDALNISVDRVKASLEGVSPEFITQWLSDYASGVVTTHIQRGPKMVGVRVWVPNDVRSTERNISNLRLRAPDGHLFPLKRVATLTVITGQPQIVRDDLKQMIAVTGRISGRDIGSVIKDVKAVLGLPGLIPKEVYYDLGGLYAQQQIAFAGLIAVFVAAVMLVFLLLLFLYESFRVALAMLATTLLALSSVFIGLWLTGIEINISSMMGMTMIVGIVTEVAIFYISEYHDLSEDVDPGTALVIAGRNRMRPIAMTTFATILALLPLALGVGQGSSMQQPLAIAIISGLAVQLPLVLIIMPVLLRVLIKLKTLNGNGRSRFVHEFSSPDEK